MTLISIPDMSCGHCKAAVESALGPISQSVEIDLEKRQAKIDTTRPENEILATLDAIGFPAKILSA